MVSVVRYCEVKSSIESSKDVMSCAIEHGRVTSLHEDALCGSRLRILQPHEKDQQPQELRCTIAYPRHCDFVFGMVGGRKRNWPFREGIGTAAFSLESLLASLLADLTRDNARGSKLLERHLPTIDLNCFHANISAGITVVGLCLF